MRWVSLVVAVVVSLVIVWQMSQNGRYQVSSFGETRLLVTDTRTGAFEVKVVTGSSQVQAPLIRIHTLQVVNDRTD
jgi:hypothetical protein